MPLVQKSPMQFKLEKEIELEKMAISLQESNRNRSFELDKIKAESSIPKKWATIKTICITFIEMPVSIIFSVLVFVILMRKMEAPEFLKEWFMHK